jgi:phosphohistidine phosphatase
MANPRTLILLRHATAGHASRDHDRPLTENGTRDAAAAGDWIREHAAPVDAVLCSTAVRTRQTLAATRIQAPTTFADELYGGDVDDILGQVALLPESAQTVLVVGHAPGIPSVAYELATVADLASDGPSGSDADEAEPTPNPELQSLRSFSACALAVLNTDATWIQLPERGAGLVTVRHPDR